MFNFMLPFFVIFSLIPGSVHGITINTNDMIILTPNLPIIGPLPTVPPNINLQPTALPTRAPTPAPGAAAALTRTGTPAPAASPAPSTAPPPAAPQPAYVYPYPAVNPSYWSNTATPQAVSVPSAEPSHPTQEESASPETAVDQLWLCPDASCLRVLPDGIQYVYDGYGLLTCITDRNKNSIEFSYTYPVGAVTGGTQYSGYLQQIKDNWGRCLAFTYNAAGYITCVTDPAGNKRQFVYNSPGLLIKSIYCQSSGFPHHELQIK